AGVSLDGIADRLLADGIDQFVDAFTRLLQATGSRMSRSRTAKVDRQTVMLPREAEPSVKAALDDWQQNRKGQRLWQLDSTLWTGSDENQWLGWLGITDDQLAHLDALQQASADIQSGHFAHAVLLGMGGSSLCPEVFRRTFGTIAGFPELRVLDSTDPGQI